MWYSWRSSFLACRHSGVVCRQAQRRGLQASGAAPTRCTAATACCRFTRQCCRRRALASDQHARTTRPPSPGNSPVACPSLCPAPGAPCTHVLLLLVLLLPLLDLLLPVVDGLLNHGQRLLPLVDVAKQLQGGHLGLQGGGGGGGGGQARGWRRWHTDEKERRDAHTKRADHGHWFQAAAAAAACSTFPRPCLTSLPSAATCGPLVPTVGTPVPHPALSTSSSFLNCRGSAHRAAQLLSSFHSSSAAAHP